MGRCGMLRLSIIGLILIVAACSGDKPPPSKPSVGWSSKSDRYRVSLFYDFGDQSGTRFVATCDAFPIFMLSGGDYVGTTGKFRLFIDDRSWTLDTWAGEHGRALIIHGPHFADAFANARKLIGFRVDDWQRSFKPIPQLAQFVAKCRAMRKADPDADGIPGIKNVS